MTLSHVGNGDITAISIPEKVYICVAFLVGIFVYAILFGNIISLVTALASRLQSKLQGSYDWVVDFLAKKQLHNQFQAQVDAYFNYLWYQNKGLDEQGLLSCLPSALRADIQLFRHSLVLHSSELFQDNSGAIRLELARSVFKMMETQYFLTGDTIIHGGDKKYDFFLLLDGEVEVIDIQGNKMITTLGAGAHFGEANLLFTWSHIRSANVVAISTCQLGVVPKDKFELLLESFPEFHEMLLEKAIDRMRETFSDNDLERVALKLDELAKVLEEDPNLARFSQEKAETLIALKIAQVPKDPPPHHLFSLNLIHLLLLIYSAFSIPFQVGFDIEVSGWLLVMECVCVAESVLYFLVTFRYAFYIEARRELEFRDIVSYYYHRFVFEDLIAIAPFNVLFPSLGVTEPFYLISFLRLLRIAAVMRIPSILEKVEVHSRHLSSSLNVVKAAFFLILLTHWSSCFWFYVNLQESGDNWVDYVGANSVSLAEQYLYAAYFIMQTATSLGYGDMIPTTDTERLVYCFLIMIGDALFAVAFGLIASAVSSLKSKFAEFLQNLKQPSTVLKKSSVPDSIITRLETYYAFNSALTERYGPIDFRGLFEHLPANIATSVVYECNQALLRNVPLLSDINSESLMEQIAVALSPRVYFPEDFIIYKNDIAEEMYFIIEGHVDIFSPDNKNVIKTLSNGDFVGEIALVTNSRRLCSVKASSLCLVFCLNKNDFNSILESFPELQEILRFEVETRRREISNEPLLQVVEDANEEQEIANALDMYTSGASPFFERKEDKRITALTGIQTYKSGIVLDNLREDKNMYRRRRMPLLNSNVRRYSQVSLGKELVLSKWSRLKMQWTMAEN